MSAARMSASTVERAAADFRVVSDWRDDPALARYNALVTVTVSTGACHVQTYLTPDECDTLAAMLVAQAAEQRQLIAAHALKAAA